MTPPLTPIPAEAASANGMARHERIRANMAALEARKASTALIGSSPLTASTEQYQTAPEEAPSEYVSLSDREYDGDSDAGSEDEHGHPVLEGMPRDGTAIIIGDHNDPTGWKIKSEVMEAQIDVWRKASANKTLRTDDGGLGTWINEWAIGYFGADDPKRPKDVNDVFFHIRPNDCLPEYREERHPDSFAQQAATVPTLSTVQMGSPTADKVFGPVPEIMSPSTRADAEWLGLV
jgi:hypothetical protein